MIRNVIFDWSGTLVDDLPAVWRATNLVLARAQRPEMTLDEFRAEFCLPFKLFYDRHVPQIPLPQLEGWYNDVYPELQKLVTPLPHACEFLEFCRERGQRMFLLSTVHATHYAAQSATTGFGKYFERPYVGVADKRIMIGRLLAENDLRAEETLFVGDMQHDIESARHGGVHACAVLTGYNGLEQLRASRPDVIVEHLGELRELLERNQFNLPHKHDGHAAGRLPVVTVGALVFNAAGEVLMVRTHKWSNLWGIPGGKIKWGEDSIAALRREFMEETNLELTDICFVVVQDCIHSPEFYRDEHFVLLNYTARCVGEPDVKLNDEAREFQWLTAPAALAMPVNRPTRVLLETVIAGGLELRSPRADSM